MVTEKKGKTKTSTSKQKHHYAKGESKETEFFFLQMTGHFSVHLETVLGVDKRRESYSQGFSQLPFEECRGGVFPVLL